jgi:hypothetical protein
MDGVGKNRVELALKGALEEELHRSKRSQFLAMHVKYAQAARLYTPIIILNLQPVSL